MTDQPIYVDNELFLGRLDEQERFRETLHTVLTSRDDDAPPFIFLLHGEGGMGKSQLTRRLYDIAAADKADISIQGDWEDVQIELGLLDERLTPQPHYVWLSAPQIRA